MSQAGVSLGGQLTGKEFLSTLIVFGSELIEYPQNHLIDPHSSLLQPILKPGLAVLCPLPRIEINHEYCALFSRNCTCKHFLGAVYP